MLTALFGGTFDPIHYGHLRPVISLAQEVGVTQIVLLPNKIPPHKPQPIATIKQRLTMLALAIEDLPLFTIDTREIAPSDTNRPSYTIDTLQQWRNENGKTASLAFIMGQDSLLNLPSWHKWQSLLDYCHLIICQRPNYAARTDNVEFQQWIDKNRTNNVKHLHDSAQGYIYFSHTPLEDISATQIRQKIKNQQCCEDLVPLKVRQYIQQQGLYYAKKN
ncbi:nicotinate-nucleotide adenylyltransferase [Gilliamella sp. ESL0441]|uniref:nicotinate-nucleotide adenylyltransferase n=1 Tax=Gilliamella sp. ESL0441 TaxID=2704654 RepID=UPI001C6966B2|nr:nicotinate-nucleotide adenylyltransferase [Gilliamella sp. ESL0441]QYN44037.1 nicotinate-nucleotide adenylyltransferase [Gilliamella sp. ESL0441]